MTFIMQRAGRLLALWGTLFVGAAAVRAAVPVVTPADAPGLKRAILARKGHVVVLNFWATSCPPCVAEFPALVQFSSRFAPKGVIVMAVSTDPARDLNSRVRPFLMRQKAAFPQFLQDADDPDAFINAFDPKWEGDLPRTFVYDKRGRLVRELQGSITEKLLEQAVRPLLRAPAR